MNEVEDVKEYWMIFYYVDGRECHMLVVDHTLAISLSNTIVSMGFECSIPLRYLNAPIDNEPINDG